MTPERTLRTIGLLGCLLGLAACSSAVGPVADSDFDFQRPKSYIDLKFAYTVRQEQEFSCGAAALATVLKYHYDMPVTEGMLLELLVKRYTFKEWQQKVKDGLSFEDLIYLAEKLGFKAQAAAISAPELEKLSGPVIVQLNLKRFEHFSVLRKKIKGVAYMSDPILGAISLDDDEFAKEYRGAVLAVWPSYVKGDYFSGLSVIRDPLSVQQALTPLLGRTFVTGVPVF